MKAPVSLIVPKGRTNDNIWPRIRGRRFAQSHDRASRQNMRIIQIRDISFQILDGQLMVDFTQDIPIEFLGFHFLSHGLPAIPGDDQRLDISRNQKD